MTFESWIANQDEDRMQGVPKSALIRAWQRDEDNRRIAQDNEPIGEDQEPDGEFK